MKDTLRYILGYCIGFLIFVVLIPYGLFELSQIDPIIKIKWPDYLIIRVILSLPFFIVGLLFMIWSNLYLFFIGKGGPTDGFNIAITPRTKKLVVTGPYRYCRNPMVFGAFCLYFSLGFFMLSLLCLIVLMVFILLIILYLRKTEEKRLVKDFGNEFIEYKRKVPMLFPRILTNK